MMNTRAPNGAIKSNVGISRERVLSWRGNYRKCGREDCNWTHGHLNLLFFENSIPLFDFRIGHWHGYQNLPRKYHNYHHHSAEEYLRLV